MSIKMNMAALTLEEEESPGSFSCKLIGAWVLSVRRQRPSLLKDKIVQDLPSHPNAYSKS